jgi:uncharacterized MnhB-related membrane protein
MSALKPPSQSEFSERYLWSVVAIFTLASTFSIVDRRNLMVAVINYSTAVVCLWGCLKYYRMAAPRNSFRQRDSIWH